MTPDQISKLPPELQPMAERCERGKGLISLVHSEFYNHDVIAALTYCLQMQEERDGFRETANRLGIQLVGKQDELRTAEATIATLTREIEKAQEMIAILWQNGKFGMSVGNALSEDGVLRKAIAAYKERKTGTALSHTPEGKT